jgi:3-methyladenine DNA glycosylase AlkD
MTYNQVLKDLKSLGNPEKAAFVARYFKTGNGQYGEGDIFLGLKVPETRSIAKKYKELPLKEIEKLLKNKIHEARQCGLMIMDLQYPKNPDQIYNLYMANLSAINNWDLVDGSAPYIVGPHLLNKDHEVLFEMAKSNNLWERRVAILSTFYFIRQKRYETALKISEMLLNDSHDLIHKAVGWMLREIGNKDRPTLEKFLDKHVAIMPRTMLRYAIEKFDEPQRQKYLKIKNTSRQA